jgi:hypothetical protein
MEHGKWDRKIKNKNWKNRTWKMKTYGDLRGINQESFMIEELQLPLLGFQIF